MWIRIEDAAGSRIELEQGRNRRIEDARSGLDGPLDDFFFADNWCVDDNYR